MNLTIFSVIVDLPQPAVGWCWVYRDGEWRMVPAN